MSSPSVIITGMIGTKHPARAHPNRVFLISLVNVCLPPVGARGIYKAVRTRSPLRFGKACAVATLLVYCAVATAQTPEVGKLHAVKPMTLHQTRYRLRAGQPATIDAPRETLDFLLHAKTRVEIAGKEARGFVVGPNGAGDQVLVAASLVTKPGEYTLMLSGITETGERRAATLSITVDALPLVPSSSTQPPVVLLNGWQIGFSSSCPISTSSAETFGSLEQDLLTGPDLVPAVYFFDNCAECFNCKIEDLGNTLAQFLGMIQYDTGALVPQVDLVGHSMGGLIARAYLSGLQGSGSLQPPTNPRIRKLILIATPNFGSFLAANNSILAGTQAAEMIPGSAFLWELNTWNQGTDDLRGVDALAIIGDQGTWPNGSATAGQNLSDGVVSITSASLGFARDVSRTRILTYCHIESVGFEIDCSGGAIASASDTISAVLSFLVDNTPGWTIGFTFAGYQQGGVYVGVENSTQYINDLSLVQFDGSALVQNPQYAIFYSHQNRTCGNVYAISSQGRTIHLISDSATRYIGARAYSHVGQNDHIKRLWVRSTLLGLWGICIGESSASSVIMERFGDFGVPAGDFARHCHYRCGSDQRERCHQHHDRSGFLDRGSAREPAIRLHDRGHASCRAVDPDHE